MSTEITSEIRLSNIAQLIKSRFNGNATTFAGRIGRSQAQVSHWTQGVRNVGERIARDIEERLDLPRGFLDEPRDATMIAAANVSRAYMARDERPLISWVRAGAWAGVEDPFLPGEGYEYIAPPCRSSNSAFWLRVEGDSMTSSAGRSFPSGALILCDPELGTQAGDFVIAKDTATQRATFKRLASDGITHILQALNPAYPAITIDSNQIRIIAKVIYFQLGEKL